MKAFPNVDKIFEESRYPVDIFEKYFDYQDKFLLKEIDELNEKLKNKISDKDIEEQVHWINLYNEFHLDFLTGTFPDIQNKTSLIILYNTFENSLKSLCNILAKALQTPIAAADLKGDDLVKCKVFFVKLCGIDEKIFQTTTWKEIDCVRKLRNCVVHNDSDISTVIKKDKSIIKRFEKIDGFELIDKHFGLIKSDFLRDFLKTINSFYHILHQELKDIQKLNMN